MLDIENIHSLTDFHRNSKSHLKRLRRTGQPEILTVNGRAEVVVQDAKAYQELLDLAEYVDTVRTLEKRLEAMRKGEKGIPFEEAFERIRADLALPEEA